jgi:3-hydroxybutyrate dehydrogenase
MVAGLTKAGYQVFFQYHRNESGAERLRSVYAATGIRIDFAAPFSLGADDFDVLINNTTINKSGEQTRCVDPAVWEKILHLNVTVPFLPAVPSCQTWCTRGWGRIVNVGSIYSVQVAVNRAPCVVSEHALSGLTKTIAREYAAPGITYTEICSSVVESRMMERIVKDRVQRRGRILSAVLDQHRAPSPTDQMAMADEMAPAALFLASEAAGFINGASVPVDGGLLA